MYSITDKEMQNKVAVSRAKKYLKQRRVTAIGFELLPETEQLKIKDLIEEAKCVKFLSGEEIIKLIKDSLDYDVKYKLIQHVVSKYNITYDNSKRLKHVFNKCFGVDNPGQLTSVKDKIKQTNLDHYGYEYAFQSPKVKDKIKQTNLERYGSTTVMQSKEVKDKIKQTFLNKYGYDSPLKCPTIKQKQANSAKSSKLEKKVEEFLKNNNFKFKTQHVISNNQSSHAFDFAIFKNDKLEILIDCDGLYYHGYICDYDDKHVRSEKYDNFRLQLIPNNVKFIVVVENHEEECFKEMFKCFNIDYDEIYR